MSPVPSKVTVVGSGGGALTIAAEASVAGSKVTIADLPRFAGNLEAVGATGAIDVQFRSGPTDSDAPREIAPIAAISTDVAEAVREAEVVVVCVPAFGHVPFAELIVPAVGEGQLVFWIGEGGGAFTAASQARRLAVEGSGGSAGGRPTGAVHAEMNSLPYAIAAVQGPGLAAATRKRGGTIIAAIPSEQTPRVGEVARIFWPFIEEAENVWETLLLNFNAVDHVATMLCNLGPIQGPGPYRLFGQGATPGVANAISAVDQEYIALRRGLGLSNQTSWEDYLVAQGLAPEKGATTYDTIQSSILAEAQFPCGPGALEHRFVSEDVPYSLVLASSIGREIGVPTPVIDSLVHLASVASGQDYWAQGRTLADWDMAGAGLGGLRRAASEGVW